MSEHEPPTLTLTAQFSQVAGVAANLATALYYTRTLHQDQVLKTLGDQERRHVGGGPARRRVEQDLERAGGRERDIDQAAAWLRGLPSDVVRLIRDDPAWPALAVRLHDVARTGHDPAEVLAHVAKVRGLGDAESIAQVLHWRLGRWVDGDERFRAGTPDGAAPTEPAADQTDGQEPTRTSTATATTVVVRRTDAAAGDGKDDVVDAELVDADPAPDQAAAAAWTGQARTEDSLADHARLDAAEATTRPDAAATPRVDEHQQGLHDAAGNLTNAATATGHAASDRSAAVTATRAALAKARAAFSPRQAARRASRGTPTVSTASGALRRVGRRRGASR